MQYSRYQCLDHVLACAGMYKAPRTYLNVISRLREAPPAVMLDISNRKRPPVALAPTSGGGSRQPGQRTTPLGGLVACTPKRLCTDLLVHDTARASLRPGASMHVGMVRMQGVCQLWFQVLRQHHSSQGTPDHSPEQGTPEPGDP